MELLLCDEGTSASDPALTFGEALVQLLRADATVLEVVQGNASTMEPASRVVGLCKRLSSDGLNCQIVRQMGIPRHAVLEQSGQKAYSLVVIGLLERGSLLRRWLRGPSTRRILQRLETPLLVVPTERKELHRILFCSGELWYPAEIIQIVSEIAGAAQAEVTLLHVVPQSAQTYPMGQYAEEMWGAMLQSDAPQAKHLNDSLSALRESGIESRINLRHGGVPEQIKAEIQEGEYDLIALGSTYTSQSLYRLFTRSITDYVVENAQRPVLVVRHHPDDAT
jgi:nucleotide-binding universal stress UspA family protein